MFSKGVYDASKKLVTEKKGFIRRTIETYKIEPLHMKRDKKGKATVGIDLTNKRSFDLGKESSNVKYECQNCLGYLMQEKNWKAHQSSAKIPKWHDIKMMFAGLGVAFILLYFINAILGRI